MKVLKWMKDHAVAILLGIVGLLGAILAIKYEREKMSGLKLDVELAKLNGKREALVAQRTAVEEDVQVSEKKDEAIGTQIECIDKAIEEVRSASTKKSAADLAANFNRLFPDRK